MRLAKLTGLEIEKLQAELKEVRATIKELKSILASRPKRMNILKQEMNEVVNQFGDDRRTEILSDQGDFTVEDLIAEEDMRFDHPNVCPILRLGEADRILYLVMPYLEGEPLSEHETKRGPISVAEGIPLLLQMCRGLAQAHELGIVHRDLKPENVMAAI